MLASIDERLRTLDTVSTVQMKQARRLDVIQDKLGKINNPKYAGLYLYLNPREDSHN